MVVEAHAKVNLTLEVFGVRGDGYHGLRSVVLPVSLSDRIELEDAPVLTSDCPYPDDLCLKAARALCPTRGATIHVEKHIPAGAGLGGGSADAAAVLIGLNELWKLGKSREQLSETGAQVGSDVPALVLGGPVLMQGRGERVERLPMRSDGEVFWLVLAKPAVACSTAEIYRLCQPRPHDDPALAQQVCQAIQSGDRRGVAARLTNDLQGPAVRLHPEIADALVSLRAAGAEGGVMSGSGSTVFGFVPSEQRGSEVAAAMVAKGYWAKCVHTIVG